MNDMSNDPNGSNRGRLPGGNARIDTGDDRNNNRMDWRAFFDRLGWEIVVFLKSLKGGVVIALIALLFIDCLAVGNHSSFWAGALPTRAPISLADTPIIGFLLPDRNPYEIAAFMAGLMTVVLPSILWFLIFSRTRYGTWRDIFLDRNTALLFAISLIGYLTLSWFEFGIFADAIASKQQTPVQKALGVSVQNFTPEESQMIAAGLVAVNALVAALTGYLFTRVKS